MSILDRRAVLAGAAVAAGIGAAMADGAQGTPDRSLSDLVNAGKGAGLPVDLSGKSILITGTSSGFGWLGAQHYARAGAKVFATMRNLPRPEADALRQLARDERLDITVLEIDVRSDAQVAAGVREAERLAGGALDVLVNNAGIMITGPTEMQDMAAAQVLFDTNLFGFQRMARAVLPAMRKARSGYIINMASQGGRVIYPGLGIYSASKFAVESWAEQLAYEVALQGIGVGIIEPGGYPTRIMENANTPSAALARREAAERAAAYPALVAQMGNAGTVGTADPMDVPRAIAELIAMPPADRPLRRMVSAHGSPQSAINAACAAAQRAMLGGGPFGAAVERVLKNA